MFSRWKPNMVLNVTIEQKGLRVKNTEHLGHIVRGSPSEYMLMMSAWYFGELSGVDAFDMRPMRISCRGKDMEDMQAHINGSGRGILCVGRENGSGAIFRNMDVKRELIPAEMIVWNGDASLSAFHCVDGLGDCTIDAIFFNVA